jgi:hypothetical protein
MQASIENSIKEERKKREHLRTLNKIANLAEFPVAYSSQYSTQELEQRLRDIKKEINEALGEK